jgi:hypothetical protein
MIRNDVEFGIAFRKARADYDRDIKGRLDAIFAQMDPALRNVVDQDQNLEAHIRSYVLDPLLEALNWQVGKNIIPEAFLRDQQTHTRRRLDYLGHERDALRPLLIVEAKRPDAPFIGVAQSVQPGGNYMYHELLAQTLHHLKDASQEKPPLLNIWCDWLDDVRNYCVNTQNNTGCMPRRLVLTNGSWLVIFANLEDAFCGDAPPSESDIFIYSNVKSIHDNARQVFELLEYNKLAAINNPIRPGEIVAHFAVEEFESAINALQISYDDTRAGREAVPTLHVVPEVILRHRRGGWIRVSDHRYEHLPHRSRDLPQHLHDVRHVHEALMTQIETVLGRRIPIATIEEHYARNLHEEMPGARCNGPEQFLVLTGSEPHFIKSASEFEQCRYRRAHLAAADGEAARNLPQGVSTNPRTHFGAGTELNCAHRAVQVTKSVQVGANNRQR